MTLAESGMHMNDHTPPDYEWRWQHLTLEDYFTALRDAGFSIDRLLEPMPDPVMQSASPDLYDRARRRPIFVIMRAVKETGSP
jgi:hypothetical protein